MRTKEGRDRRSLPAIFTSKMVWLIAYWHDGVVILDVGAGLKGGSQTPEIVSQFRFNHNSSTEMAGWPERIPFSDRDYLFIGDEVFPSFFDISS